MTRKGSGLFRHAASIFWLGLAEAAVRGGNVVLQFLLARALGRGQYGVFAYAFSLAMILVPAGGIGLLEALVRRGAHEEGVAAALSEFFPLRVGSALATLAVLAVVSRTHPADASVVLVVGLFALFRALTAFLAASFRAAEVIWKEFAVRCGEAAALLTVAFASIRFRPGLVPVSSILAGAAGLFFFLTLGAFRRFFPGLTWRWPRAWAAALVRAAPLGLPALMGILLLRTDVVLIRQLTGDASATADYAAAVNLVLGLGLVPVTISAALFPALSRKRRVSGRVLAAGATGFLALGGALAFLLSTLAPRIVRLAYGSEFDSAAKIVATLSPFLVFLAPTVFAATVLASRNAAGSLALLALVPLGLKVGVDFALLPAGLARVPLSSTVLQAAALAGSFVLLTLSQRRADFL
ncbi:MAG: oligosaccharide flippase family protein [Thermoanaerobaculia bacterium]